MQFQLIVPKLLVKGKGKTETLSEVAEWQHIQHMNIFQLRCMWSQAHKNVHAHIDLASSKPGFFRQGPSCVENQGGLQRFPIPTSKVSTSERICRSTSRSSAVLWAAVPRIHTLIWNPGWSIRILIEACSQSLQWISISAYNPRWTL